MQVILPVSSELVERLNEHAHKFAFDIVFVRLRNQLAAVPEMRVYLRLLQSHRCPKSGKPGEPGKVRE